MTRSMRILSISATAALLTTGVAAAQNLSVDINRVSENEVNPQHGANAEASTGSSINVLPGGFRSMGIAALKQDDPAADSKATRTRGQPRNWAHPFPNAGSPLALPSTVIVTACPFLIALNAGPTAASKAASFVR